MKRRNSNLWYRILSVFVSFIFLSNVICPPNIAYTQTINALNLPLPGIMVNPSPAFTPVLLKGMTIHPEDPLKFDFILDEGNTDFDQDQIKSESQRLIKYFLASLTVPKDDLWVNLSPYEGDRVIPEELGKTDLGRDLLSLDYILKQLTASLMYPEDELGKSFWEKVYQKAEEKYGTTEIPVNTFNKVWILPEKATVYEHGQTVYVVESKLKVMLDEDYLAMQRNAVETEVPRYLKNNQLKKGQGAPAFTENDLSVSTNIIREIILPEIEKEVNEGQNFAKLRQIYNSLILAKWYKETIQKGLLSRVYVDQNKVVGIENNDPSVNVQIYDRYMKAFKKGAFNYIKEDYDHLSGKMIPRKYFSGGIPLAKTLEVGYAEDGSKIANSVIGQKFSQVVVQMEPQGEEQAASPISVEDVLNMFRSLRGSLEDGGHILSVKAGEVIDFSVLNSAYEWVGDNWPLIGISVVFMVIGGVAIVGDHLDLIDKVLQKRVGKKAFKKGEIIQIKKRLKDQLEKISNLDLGESLDVKVNDLFQAFQEIINSGNKFEVRKGEGEGSIQTIEYILEENISSDDEGFSVDDIKEFQKIKKVNKGQLKKNKKLGEVLMQSLSKIKGTEFVLAEQIGKFGHDMAGAWTVDYRIRYAIMDVKVPPLEVVEAKKRASSSVDVGGIDMNAIDVNRQGSGMDIHFDFSGMEPLLNKNINGFAPVIINITPMQSILPLLGLEPARHEKDVQVSQLN